MFVPYIFAGLALVTLIVAVWSPRWPVLKGTIDTAFFESEWDTESEGNRLTLGKKGNFYILYSYVRNGAKFQDSRIKPLWEINWQLSGSPEISGAKDYSAWYREGGTVDVHYCPLFPRWVCLEPGGYAVGIILAVASIVLFSLS